MGTKDKAIQSGHSLASGKPLKIPADLLKIIQNSPTIVDRSMSPLWTALEDAVIVAMRDRGCAWMEITKVFKSRDDLGRRSRHVITDRYRALKGEGS